MAYEIEVHGTPNNDGIRKAPVNGTNFPPTHTTGSEELKFGTDIISDPAENDNADDPTSGWKRGIGIGGQQA